MEDRCERGSYPDRRRFTQIVPTRRRAAMEVGREMPDNRVQAAEAYIQSMKSGEPGAAQRASNYLAPDVVLSTGREEVKGHDEVLARITGQWPQTPVYTLGGWSAPIPAGDQLKVHADFPAMGAAVKEVNLTFSFNAAGQISRVDQQNVMPPA